MPDALPERAAEIVKMVKLASMPEMDEVAIMLNRKPTYDEINQMAFYHKALQLAAEISKPISDLAVELNDFRK